MGQPRARRWRRRRRHQAVAAVAGDPYKPPCTVSTFQNCWCERGRRMNMHSRIQYSELGALAAVLSGPVLHSPCGILLSGIQQTVVTNVKYFYVKEPCCGGLVGAVEMQGGGSACAIGQGATAAHDLPRLVDVT